MQRRGVKQWIQSWWNRHQSPGTNCSQKWLLPLPRTSPSTLRLFFSRPRPWYSFLYSCCWIFIIFLAVGCHHSSLFWMAHKFFCACLILAIKWINHFLYVTRMSLVPEWCIIFFSMDVTLFRLVWERDFVLLDVTMRCSKMTTSK